MDEIEPIKAEEVRTYIIEVVRIYPAVPFRNYDYCATFKGYEPGELIAYGATEHEAIKALLEFHEQAYTEIK